MSSVIQVDSIPATVTSRVIRVTGKAHPSVITMDVGADFLSLAPIQYTAGRFSAVLELTPGRNQFIIQPYATGVIPMQSETVVVDYELTDSSPYQVPTSLDNHATELGYERLPGERNVSFKKRLLQGNTGRDNVRTHVPIAFATEVGFPYSKDILRVSTAHSTYGRSNGTNVYISVTPTDFKYTCDQLLVSEGPVVFDSGYPYVTLLNEVSPFGSIDLILESGDKVPASDYEYDSVTNRVWLSAPELQDSDIIVLYRQVISYTLDGVDLASLKTTVDASGHIELEIIATEFHTTTTDADWTIPQSWLSVPEDVDQPANSGRDQPGVLLSVSELRSYPLHEHAADMLQGGHGLGTKLEKFVGEVNRVDHRTWKDIVVSRDGLRDSTVNPLYSSFPHLTDPHRGHWGTTEYNIHEVQYLGAGVKDPVNPFVGVLPTWWQSGTGQLGDLEQDSPVSEVTDPADITTEDTDINTFFYGIL